MPDLHILLNNIKVSTGKLRNNCKSWDYNDLIQFQSTSSKTPLMMGLCMPKKTHPVLQWMLTQTP